MKKQNLGALVILAGIGFIGFIWFKRNKPTTADKQLADLTNLSTALKVGSTGDLDKPFEYTEEQKQNAGKNPYTYSFYSDKEVKDWYKNMTPAEVKALSDAVNQACPSCAGLANIGTINLDNVDFSNLGNIGFTNIKI